MTKFLMNCQATQVKLSFIWDTDLNLLTAGSSVSFYSAYVIKENNVMITDAPQCSLDFLALLHYNGIPPYERKLKKGAICCVL